MNYSYHLNVFQVSGNKSISEMDGSCLCSTSYITFLSSLSTYYSSYQSHRKASKGLSTHWPMIII